VELKFVGETTVDNIQFKIIKEPKGYTVRDMDGNNYGSYETKEEAEKSKEAWTAYYEEPI
jgi:hypothetical protein